MQQHTIHIGSVCSVGPATYAQAHILNSDPGREPSRGRRAGEEETKEGEEKAEGEPSRSRRRGGLQSRKSKCFVSASEEQDSTGKKVDLGTVKPPSLTLHTCLPQSEQPVLGVA